MPVIAAVVISSPLVSASNAPDFPMVMYASSSAFFIRLRLAVKPSMSRTSPNVFFSSAANFGKTPRQSGSAADELIQL